MGILRANGPHGRLGIRICCMRLGVCGGPVWGLSALSLSLYSRRCGWSTRGALGVVWGSHSERELDGDVLIGKGVIGN